MSLKKTSKFKYVIGLKFYLNCIKLNLVYNLIEYSIQIDYFILKASGRRNSLYRKANKQRGMLRGSKEKRDRKNR